MRKGFLFSALAFFPAAGLTFAQPPSASAPPTAASPPAISSTIVAAPQAGPACAGDPSCGNDCRPSCCEEVCGPPGRFWGSAEYLLWWLKDSRVPALVTANANAPLAVLGAPGTSTIYGNGDLDAGTFSGGRFAAGFWLNDCHTLGVEGNLFFLPNRSNNFLVGNLGSPAIAGSPAISRPFFNVVTGLQSAQAVSSPGVLSGTVQVNNSSSFWGAGANGISNLRCSCDSRVDLLGGFRYLDLGEGLTIQETLLVAPGALVGAGTGFGVRDQFNTTNRFYGGQLGARGERRFGNAFVNASGLLALGCTQQEVDVNGATRFTSPAGATVVRQGGLLALGSNIGNRNRNVFSVVPEVGANVGYQVTDNLRAFVGYTFLYWSNVARPGDQIDLNINTSQIPSAAAPGTLVGPARPAPLLRDSDFWANGVNFGLEFRF